LHYLFLPAQADKQSCGGVWWNTPVGRSLGPADNGVRLGVAETNSSDRPGPRARVNWTRAATGCLCYQSTADSGGRSVSTWGEVAWKAFGFTGTSFSTPEKRNSFQLL